MSIDDRLQETNNVMSQFGLSVQSTYSPIIRDQFYSLVPANLRYYYMNTIRRALYWYQGYVPEVHKPQAGIFSTGVGNSIIHEITKLTTGGRVFFANKYAEKSNKGDKNGTLTEFNKWSDHYLFQDAIKTYVEYAAAGGTAAGVAYVNNERDLTFVPYRIDQFFYETDYNNRCTKFTLFNGNYTAKVSNGQNREETETNFYILEERYFNDKLEPVMKMAVHVQYGNLSTGQSFDLTKASERRWEQLPSKIQKLLKRDFPDVKFGLEHPITFTKDLGVYILKWTTSNRVPEIRMGESALLNCFAYLLEYDTANSEMVTDMYIARGKVIVPEQMRNPSEDYGGYYSGFDTMVFQKLPMLNSQDQKPMSIQFELRAEEWSKTRNSISENIASAIGVSGSDLFSFLRDVSGGSKTATQIAAESQKTISYIYEKRSIIEGALSLFVRLWKEFYKQTDDITVKFSSQNMVNKMVSIDEVRMKKEIGTSTYDLFQELYPDEDPHQIEERVERKFAELERMKKMEASIGMEAFNNHLKNINDNPKGKGIVETEETSQTQEIELNETAEKAAGEKT